MLPGFRFFLATIVLAASILVFGLGAAALLRATHEEFAVAPSLRTIQPPLPVRARQPEAATPALAMLRVEIPAASTEELPSAASTESASPADAPAQIVETPAAVEAPAAAAQPSPQDETPSVAANLSSASGTAAATPNDVSPSEIVPAPLMAEAPPAPAAAEIAPTPEAVQPVAETVPAPSASVPVAEVAPAAEALAQTPATTPVVASPPPAEAKSLTASAQAPAPDPSPTRLVAVSATGCEILPSAPDRPGAIPEAPRVGSPPAQGNPAKDKTAKLEKEPAATVPKATSRPQQKARANKRRSTAIKHRHHGVPRVRQARHEVVRPQPQPDLFTFLFGGGAQQPTPVSQ
ncbi:hypothetical protein ASC80_11775 [Afipia sp. Root123D2]|uniref:hypothetical protein n=1 Tax=Afipia sp. Root123D2 TaxID=1736436 RepID=UPI0006F4FCF4|nr:hypothetical protein [Afipia sp. Root123D2]KQW20851.1 hypothetical protein ASC80_11775 [Afipia sp. Root123D2]